MAGMICSPQSPINHWWSSSLGQEVKTLKCKNFIQALGGNSLCLNSASILWTCHGGHTMIKMQYLKMSYSPLKSFIFPKGQCYNPLKKMLYTTGKYGIWILYYYYIIYIVHKSVIFHLGGTTSRISCGTGSGRLRCCPRNPENEYIPYILMVYTKHIPSIWHPWKVKVPCEHEYAIYQAHTWYKLLIKSIYQVYIPGIKQV